MKNLKAILLSITLLFLLSQSALAIPTFQTYIEGSTAGTWGSDADSWFATTNPFNLVVVGAYSSNTQSLEQVTLVVSVPQGQTGTISISGGDVGAILLYGQDTSGLPFDPFAPANPANINLLVGDGINPDGYADKDGPSGFLSDSISFNNHYPFQDGVSDFLIYGIGDFDPLGEIHNYNADTSDPDYVPPPIPLTANSLGEEKVFSVSVTGFSWVHFDVIGYEMDLLGGKNMKCSWEINPGSHDATFIPAPGAILLGSIGIGLVGWLRRRKSL